MDMKEIERFYCTREFDPKSREFSKILKFGRLNGKRVLVIGAYGILNVAFRLRGYASEIFAVNSNQELITKYSTMILKRT